MSAVEKAMNKDDLTAYKHYDSQNYAMQPGVQSSNIQNEHRRVSADFGQKGSPRHSFSSAGGGPKRMIDAAQRVLEDQHRMQ
jgi:hypothetical protein